jgi:hypothetical protein
MNLDLPEQAASAAALMALVRTASDPEATQNRLEALVAATRESDMIHARAEKAIAAADVAKRGAEAALADLAKQVSEFQAWSTGTEKNLKAREAAVRTAEEAVAGRERDCANQVADIAQRITEHTHLMRRLQAHLAEFV